MGKFELINPILAGNIKTTFDESKPDKAAQAFWETLTSDKKLIVNELHRFMFTLKGGNNNELHHYEVRETRTGGNVEYRITNITKDVDQKNQSGEIDEFLKEVERVKSQLNGIKGGGDKKKKSKRYKDMDDDSSSSSSSDDDEFDYERLRMRGYNTPISYWWYSPLIYRVKKIFTPVFTQPIAPYVQLWLPMR